MANDITRRPRVNHTTRGNSELYYYTTSVELPASPSSRALPFSISPLLSPFRSSSIQACTYKSASAIQYQLSHMSLNTDRHARHGPCTVQLYVAPLWPQAFPLSVSPLIALISHGRPHSCGGAPPSFSTGIRHGLRSGRLVRVHAPDSTTTQSLRSCPWTLQHASVHLGLLGALGAPWSPWRLQRPLGAPKVLG